jgi:pimeloyl-ACP methyl ester carboxylesterase
LNTIKIGKSDGYPLIMLHGWGQSLQSLKPLAELLGNYCQVHLIDLPGFGQSPLPEADWNTLQYAEAIFDYAQSQGLKQFDILGHSFGGSIAIRLASQHEKAINRLVLIGARGLPRQSKFTQKLYFSFVKYLSKLVKLTDKILNCQIYEKYFIAKFGSRDYKNASPGRMRNILVKTVTENTIASAQKILKPTLLLWGEDDTETPIYMAQKYHELIKNSKLIILPAKDHFPFNDVGSHLCAHYILNFLSADNQKKQFQIQAEAKHNATV